MIVLIDDGEKMKKANQTLKEKSAKRLKEYEEFRKAWKKFGRAISENFQVDLSRVSKLLNKLLKRMKS